MTMLSSVGSQGVAVALDLAAGARSVPLVGRAVSCPLCRWSFRWFTQGGSSIRPKTNGYCPRCNAKARHRWLWLNLPDVLAACDGPPTLLHFSPAHSTFRAFRRLGGLRTYVPVARSGTRRAVAQIDLEHLALRSSSFDVVVCVHVLEHLDRDIDAMQSLHDVVRPGGIVVIGVPLRSEHQTLEDPSVTDPAERTARFGEPDHRRWYGHDIVDRLSDAGFAVESRPSANAALSIRSRYGVTDREGLFICHRQSA